VKALLDGSGNGGKRHGSQTNLSLKPEIRDQRSEIRGQTGSKDRGRLITEFRPLTSDF